jgi:Rhodopirellula transposase DDE domain
VEQDRASLVLVHHPELAWQAARYTSGHRESDRRHDNDDRPTVRSVRSRIDNRIYAKGRRISDKQLELVNLEPHDFHGEWNYTTT